MLWGSKTPGEVLRVEECRVNSTSKGMDGAVKVLDSEGYSAREESETDRGALPRSRIELYQSPQNLMFPCSPSQPQLPPSIQLLDIIVIITYLSFFIVCFC